METVSKDEIFEDKNALSGLEIKECLDNSDFSYYTTYLEFVNNLKTIKQAPCFVIVNTAHSGQSGEHWFAIIRTESGQTVSFDSYGRDLSVILAPEGQEVPSWLMDCVNGCPIKIQNVESVVCGYYILDYIHLLLRNEEQVNKTFSDISSIYHLQTHNLSATEEYNKFQSELNDEKCLQRVRSEYPYFRLVVLWISSFISLSSNSSFFDISLSKRTLQIIKINIFTFNRNIVKIESKNKTLKT